MALETMRVELTDRSLAIVGRVLRFLEAYPEDGEMRLELFLNDDKMVWDTQKVQQVTGWSNSKLQKLRATGKLSYLPENPCAYLPWILRKDLERMLVGGTFGKPKRHRRKKKAPAAKAGGVTL
ncbi:hypothetical protein GURASL_30190 [Geotalea uraniireducens]|uniref:DNA-binding protein n=1 Tax=Geotalea uraniireducens TaxID=351604 RepID=A0ABM8ENS3_9BACT|nr:hypothetical protein [Geotalea uraniireducens]BDV44096.1 hypothetical protein GURASL_30190 [Geotalea uraniireducens]